MQWLIYFCFVLPTVSIKDLGIDLTEEQAEKMASKCCGTIGPAVGSIKKLTKNDVYKIYMNAK